MDDRYLKKITLTAKSEDARSPRWSVDREFEEIRWSTMDLLPTRHLLGPSIGSLTGIRLDDWEVRFETDYRADFKKVASVVGKDKAAEVLRALGRPAPADWDKSA